MCPIQSTEDLSPDAAPYLHQLQCPPNEAHDRSDLGDAIQCGGSAACVLLVEVSATEASRPCLDGNKGSGEWPSDIGSSSLATITVTIAELYIDDRSEAEKAPIPNCLRRPSAHQLSVFVSALLLCTQRNLQPGSSSILWLVQRHKLKQLTQPHPVGRDAQ